MAARSQQRRRIIASALILAGVAVAFYITFIVMAVTRA